MSANTIAEIDHPLLGRGFHHRAIDHHPETSKNLVIFHLEIWTSAEPVANLGMDLRLLVRITPIVKTFLFLRLLAAYLREGEGGATSHSEVAVVDGVTLTNEICSVARDRLRPNGLEMFLVIFVNQSGKKKRGLNVARMIDGHQIGRTESASETWIEAAVSKPCRDLRQGLLNPLQV